MNLRTKESIAHILRKARYDASVSHEVHKRLLDTLAEIYGSDAVTEANISNEEDFNKYKILKYNWEDVQLDHKPEI